MATNFPETRGVRPKPFNLTLDATQTNIDEGELESQSHCPIALALRDSLDCRYVKVNLGGIMLLDAAYSGYSARLPAEMEDFIRRFDAEEKVEPRSFSLSFRPFCEV